LAYYPDLVPCDYFGFDPEAVLLPVGWLEPGHPYAEGEPGRDFVAALAGLLADPWKALSFRGWHGCSCRRFPRTAATFRLRRVPGRRGVHNLFVPGRRCVFVAPELILHYIDAHGYCPPKVFQTAVLSCPPMRSIDYFKAIVRRGPRGLAEKALAELDRLG
jgi:hypothetical protein